MLKRKSLCCWMTCVFALSSSLASAADVVTLETLLEEMTTRETLARLPEPAYTCSQSSSYDRDSDDPDNKQTWFANGDRSQWIRVEEHVVDGQMRKEWVMMDEAGPGAIVRFWGTWHGPRGEKFSNGTLRVYLDRSEVPAIEGSIQEVLDQGLLTKGPLSQGVSPESNYARRGHNLYLPIPYAKHCKVTYSTDVHMDRGARTGEALYYQINHRSYEPGTQVETFTMDRLARAKEILAATQSQLVNGVPISGETLGESFEGTISTGDSASLDIKGSKAIRQIAIKLDAADLLQALRSTVLKMEFDGKPAVWVPVGEFFGIGYQPSIYKTLYTEMTDDGQMIAKWIMPFEKSAKITVENLGSQTIERASLKVIYTPWKWDTRSMHFHATWHELHHVDTFIGADKPGAGAYDVNYVTIKGKGVYVGDTLTVFNGAARWWGEGDEKIYVDGETFPSHFGTGTEDYYGYAWCRPEKFAAPFHAQPTGEGNLAGGFAVNSRYRALDTIPFTESLKFDMELWHWANTKVNYAPTTFFYARPGAIWNIQPAPHAAARPITRTRAEMGTVHFVSGALEAEVFKIASMSGGTTRKQKNSGWGWSNESQLWWRGGSVGDELILEFPAKSAGRYSITANLTQAPDYAEVQLLVNSQQAKTIDGFATEVNSHEVELGEFDLAAGTNRLTVRLSGHNSKARQRGMFGLDYLKIDQK